MEFFHATQPTEIAVMTTQTQPSTRPAPNPIVSQKAQELRQLFDDAPQLAKTALENVMPTLISLATEAEESPSVSAGRVGLRQGNVSELSFIIPFAPGGAKRLRAILKLLNGNFSAGKKVGTLHNMRFAFVDNDTKLLFATAYDGAWDPYIDDFATKIPDEMDMIFSALEGWQGIRSPQIKDWIVKHQIPAAGWYVAHPELTVAEAERLMRTGKALETFLDNIG
jgi:hypothetical protein